MMVDNVDNVVAAVWKDVLQVHVHVLTFEPFTSHLACQLEKKTGSAERPQSRACQSSAGHVRTVREEG